jgi:hypothetical protein
LLGRVLARVAGVGTLMHLGIAYTSGGTGPDMADILVATPA